MKRKLPVIFLLLAAGLILFVSCTPAARLETPTSFMTYKPSFTPYTGAPLTPTLSSESLTWTAEFASTLAVAPNSTSLTGVSNVRSAPDLGWGAVYGVITDAVNNRPIEGAIVRCEQYPYTSPIPSPGPCFGTSATNSDGLYSFGPVFFRNTDGITLLVEAPGYSSLRFEQTVFSVPELHADLGLFPLSDGSLTPTSTFPAIMCTAPVCNDGVLVCGNAQGCAGGCGTICQLATPTP